ADSTEKLTCFGSSHDRSIRNRKRIAGRTQELKLSNLSILRNFERRTLRTIPRTGCGETGTDRAKIREEQRMSKVRVLVGTRKGAFILTWDGKRQNWEARGPHFTGWEIYHVKGSPADPNRIYASQTSGWFGQIIQRSSDGGKTWETPG